MPRKLEQWTKRCDNGTDCVGSFESNLGYYVPDDVDICDRCLLVEYELLHKARHDSCDHEGMGPEYYEEDDVIAALRRARRG